MVKTTVSEALMAAAEDREECAICLDYIQPTAASLCTLPCSHRYHASCVDELRSQGVQQVCPLCRAELPESAENLYGDATTILFALKKKVEPFQSRHAPDARPSVYVR